MGKGNRSNAWNRIIADEIGETSADGGKHKRDESFVNDMYDGEWEKNDSSEAEMQQQINDVLRLHSSDNPGMQLVAVPLTGTNFLNWSRQIKRALGAKSKLELLDGSLAEPDPSVAYYKQWIKVDYMVSCWIINSISKELVNSFSHYDTTKKLWDALCRRFDRSNGPKIAKLEKEIRGYEQGNLTVMDYFSNLTILWDEMDMVLPPVGCTCHARRVLDKREEDRRLVQFLLGLNDVFENTRSQILLMEPLPSVDKAYSMVAQVEDEKSMKEGLVDDRGQLAMYAQRNTGFQSGAVGEKFGQKERWLSKEERRRLRCSHCKENGHEAHECFKLHGYPDWFKRLRENKGRARINYVGDTADDVSIRSGEGYESKQGVESQSMDIAGIVQTEIAKYIGSLQSGQHGNQPNGSKNEVNFVQNLKECDDTYDGHFAFSVVPSMDSDVWVVDSGASAHVCGNREMLHTVFHLQKAVTINLPDGSTKHVTMGGRVRLNKDLVLTDVLYIPGFTHNLLSVAQLIKDNGLKCVFTNTHCVLQRVHNEQIVGIGKIDRNLYVMEVAIENHFTHYFKAEELSLQQWHIFLGHPSITTMRHMPQLSDKFHAESIKAIEECEVCFKAKQARNPFPTLERRTDSLFELVHADLWGPYGEESVSNTKYVLTLVEDHSRAIWTYLVSSKDLVCKVLTTFVNMVYTHFQKRVKFFRTDNGSELCNKRVSELFSTLGIIHQRSCVYTPQQNGVVERRHRTLLEAGRALMFQSSLPLKFWPYSILTATWMLNRVPSRILGWKTPYELLHGTPPDYSMLRPLGCLAYAVNMVGHRGKFDSRSLKCIFLGYDASHKGYVLYDMDSSRVLVSRDVKFFVDIFPYALSNISSAPTTLPFPHFPDNFPSNIPEFSAASSPALCSEDSPVVFDEPDSSGSDELGVTLPSPAHVTETASPDHAPPAARRSTRTTKPPIWMNDYVGNISTNLDSPQSMATTTPYTFPYIVSPSFSTTYNTFLFNLQMIPEPTSYKQACLYPEWVQAMNSELDALIKNNTWEITDLPQGKRAIGCKWVYRIKVKTDGTVDKYKARLVAQGFSQKYGIDYTEVFSPVAKLVTVRVLLAMAASLNWHLHQLDVNNAFLHGFLHDEIYMTVPQGFQGAATGKVCKLVKSLYGLKQASREWNAEFCNTLFSHGFTQSIAEPCLFHKGSGHDYIALLVYVDDVLVVSPSLSLIQELKDLLHAAFTIKDLGEAKYFLGMEIVRGDEGIALNQRKYVLDILTDAGMLNCKPVATPLPANLNLSHESSGEILADPEPYRRLVGRLLYLNLTRPDISFAVQQLSQFMKAPCTGHWDSALHVLKYLKGSPSLGLFYSSTSDFKVTAYSDADYGNCLDTRLSISGYCIFLGDCLVSWRCKKQNTVSTSSAEVEYRALGFATRELLWISYLLVDLQVPLQLPVPLLCDNHAAIHITKNPVFHERTKHLEIDCHLVRQHYRRGFLIPLPISTVVQLADLFTKSLPGPRFRALLSKMKMLDLHSSSS